LNKELEKWILLLKAENCESIEKGEGCCDGVTLCEKKIVVVYSVHMRI